MSETESYTRRRDELRDGEIFYSLNEARMAIECWRRHCHIERPLRSLVYKPPALDVFIPAFAAQASAQLQSAQPPELAPRPTLP